MVFTNLAMLLSTAVFPNLFFRGETLKIIFHIPRIHSSCSSDFVTNAQKAPPNHFEPDARVRDKKYHVYLTLNNTLPFNYKGNCLIPST
jgi:hypothetical protein